MSRSLVLAACAACAGLALAPAALASYPSTIALQDGPGVGSVDGSLRFVAAKSGADTRVEALDARTGSVVRSTTIAGSFGVPTLSGATSTPLGMRRDGGAFVLQSTGSGRSTSFRLVRTGDLGLRDAIRLAGTYSFDALSPDGSRLYLVQHVSAQQIDHYIVRAYDLGEHALLPGRIADKAQRGWVMQGWPASRAVTLDGRWVYTMYVNPGGFPFVHALDTVKGVAHCVGFSFPGDQSRLITYRLALRGPKLLVLRPDRTVYRSIDRTTWAVARR